MMTLSILGSYGYIHSTTQNYTNSTSESKSEILLRYSKVSSHINRKVWLSSSGYRYKSTTLRWAV